MKTIDPAAAAATRPSGMAAMFDAAHVTDEELLFLETEMAYYRGRTGKGSYRIRFAVEQRGEIIPNFYLRTGGDVAGEERLAISVEPGFVRVFRDTYQRGGRLYTVKDPRHYTLCIEVHPASGRMMYYMDDDFLGEMNLGESDSPLSVNGRISLQAVGEGEFAMAVRDFCLEEIACIPPRRYAAPDVWIDRDTVFPAPEHPPAATIYLVDALSLPLADRMMLVTLQGLVNRTTPRLMLDFRAYNGYEAPRVGYQNDTHVELLRASGREVLPMTAEQALEHFSDCFAGWIVGDCAATNYTENVATSLAGVLDGVVISEERYRALPPTLQAKPTLVQLDTLRFASSVDAYRYVREHYGDRFCRTLLFHTNPTQDNRIHAPQICRDYAVMARAFTFCTTDVRTQEDYDFYMSLFASNAPNTGVIGFGDGCFPEFEMFQICGQFAKYFIYGFSVGNVSLFRSLECPPIRPQPAARCPTLQPNTVYVTYHLSEGDNLSWDYHLWMRHLTERTVDESYVGKSFSFCGALYYLAPALLARLFAAASPEDSFFMDGGGLSNLASPDDFAVMYRQPDRERMVEQMLALTEHVLKSTDTVALRALHNISDAMSERFAAACPSLRLLMSSYAERTEILGGSKSYASSIRRIGQMVRCRLHMTTQESEGDLRHQIVQLSQSPEAREARDGIVFCETFCHGNPTIFSDGWFDRMHRGLCEGSERQICVVRSEQLAALYLAYCDGG